MGGQVERFFKGAGCHRCRKTGFRGRMGIHELLVVNDDLREAVVARAGINDLRRLARAAGLVTIREDGLRKVREGITTVEELIHATGAI
jgi:type IV pilus assembly protein PilB